jgi:hypothetical protein
MPNALWVVYTLGLCCLLIVVTHSPMRDWLSRAWARVIEWWERMPLALAVLLIAITTTACSSSPVIRATTVADSAAVITQSAEPVLRRFCVDVIASLPEPEYLERRKICDPAIATYEAVRVAHIALRAALIAYDAVMGGPKPDLAKILEAEAAVRTAVLRLAQTIAELAAHDAR